MSLVKKIASTAFILASSLIIVVSTPLAFTVQAQENNVTSGFSNTLLTTTPDSGKKFEPNLKESSISTQSTFENSLSAEELKLVDHINSYRTERGLAAIPVSKSLTTVAQLHARDLSLHGGNPWTNPCNIHTWSGNFPAGFSWTPVCYTDANPPWQLMASKGREITRGVYSADTWENSHFVGYPNGSQAGNNADYAMGRIAGMPGWPQSPGHNAMMLNQDFNGSRWSTQTWRALGVGIVGGYAVMWVGNQTDPAGTIPLNPQTQITSPNSNKNVFDVGQTIPINANASSLGGTITRVEFYNGSTLIGTDTNGGDGWSFNWVNAIQGSYSIKTRAYGNNGTIGESNAMNIQVVSGYTPKIYYPRYENKNGSHQWVLMANPSLSQTVQVRIKIGSSIDKIYTVAPNATITPNFEEVLDGPVTLYTSNSADIISTLRTFTRDKSSGEYVGIDASKLDSKYYFTWNDSKNGTWTWHELGNPNDQPIQVRVRIGNINNPIINQIVDIPAKGYKPISYANIQDGPVIIESISNINSQPAKFYATQRTWTVFKSSEEYPGIGASSLENKYYFTWNDTKNGTQTWTLVGNPNANPVNVRIRIGSLTSPLIDQVYTIPAYGRITPQYMNIQDGPITVESVNPSDKIYATQRVFTVFNSSNEYTGIGASTLKTKYYFTWNDTKNGTHTWTLIGNPNSTPITVRIKIGNQQNPLINQLISIPAYGRITPSYGNIQAGPITVEGSDATKPFYATQRVFTVFNSSNEYAGIGK